MNKMLQTLQSSPWIANIGRDFQHYYGILIENNPSKHHTSDEDEIYPLTAQEVADAQKADATLKHCFKRNHVFDKGVDIRLVDDTSIVCKEGRMIIPKPLQGCAVMWYHHYLQHPGHTRLEETMQATMYWKGMKTTIGSITKTCKTC